MKKLLLSFAYLLVFVLPLFLSSCEKEEASIMMEPNFEISPDQAFLNGLKSKIPFLSITSDEEADVISGWFINNRAELRTFSISGTYQFDIRNEEFSSYYIDLIHDAGRTVGKVDIPELVDQIKTAQTLDSESHKRGLTEGATVSQAFISLAHATYESEKDHGENCGCQGGEGASNLRLVYTNVLLQSTGAVDFEADSAERQTLVAYINSFKDQTDN